MAIRIPIVTDFNSSGIKKAVGSLTGLEKMALQATAALAALGAVGAVVAIRQFAAFDAKMTQSLAIMGDVSETLRGDMVDAAREVAKQTTFSAEQAAESYFFLASAGLDAQQSIAALPQVAAFAQAGMFDMARATDLATDAQSALGLSSDNAGENLEELTRITDVLVKANTLANASVEQFGIALTTKAGSSAKALGIEVEEVVAVLSAFADQGIKAELAGNAFSIVVRDLTTKALTNADAFEKMGVVIFDTDGELRNMADIIENLEDVLAGFNDEQQKATLLALGFSDRSVTNVQALLGQSDAIREYEKELRNANGTTKEIAENQLETFNAQLQLLQSALADTAIEIGGILIPIVEDLVDIVNDQIIPALQDFAEYLKTPEGQQELENIRLALVNIADASIKISLFIGNNIDKLGQLLITLGAVRIAWGVLVSSVILYNSSTLGAVATTNALRTAITRTGIGALVVGLGFVVDGLINVSDKTGLVNEGDLSALERELLDIETQANNAAGAIGGLQVLSSEMIPASNTGQISNKPENPQPGQRFTWFNYSGENGQAVWWQQTWTGTEWTEPEKMTYSPSTGSRGTPAKSAADFVNDFFSGLDDAVAKETARMELADLGISDALIDDILGAEGWTHVYDEIVSGGEMMAKSLQSQFNQTAEGAKELAAQLEKITELETAMGDALAMADASADGLVRLFEASEDLGATAKGLDDYFDSLLTGLDSLLSAKEFDSVQKDMENWFDQNLFTIETYANRRDNLLQDRAFATELIFGTAQAITAAGDITDLINNSLNKTKEIDVSEVIEGVVDSADGLRGFKTTITKNYTEVIEDTANAADNLVANFKGVVSRTKEFLANLKTLKELGLDPMLFNQLIEAGADAGGATAQALIDGGADTINEVNSLQSELEELGVDIGEETYNTMKNAGDQFTSGIVDGIENNLDSLELSAETAAQTFADAFEEQLQLLLKDLALPTVGSQTGGGVTPRPGDFAPGAETTFDGQDIFKIRNPESGQSLADIASEYGVDYDAIVDANPKFFDPSHKDYKAGYQGGEYLYDNTLINIPQLAEGGIAMGEVLAMIGEAGPEAVIPLDKLNSMMNGGGDTYNINVTANTRAGGAAAGEEIVKALKAYQRQNGPIGRELTGFGA